MDLSELSAVTFEGGEDGRGRPDLTTRQLRVFIVVYEERSVTDAADMLLLSQPSVSRIIKALESRLETSLFERTRRGLLPTADADLLFDAARAALGEIDRAVDRIRAGGDRRGIHVGAGSCLLMAVAPSARAFVDEGGIVGSVQFADGAGIIEQVITRSLDVGFLAALPGQIPEGVSAELVGAIEHAVFGPAAEQSAGLALPPPGSWEREIFDATGIAVDLPAAATTAPGAAAKRLLREGYTVHLPVICGKDVPEVEMVGDPHEIGVYAISASPIDSDSEVDRFARHISHHLS